MILLPLSTGTGETALMISTLSGILTLNSGRLAICFRNHPGVGSFSTVVGS